MSVWWDRMRQKNIWARGFNDISAGQIFTNELEVVGKKNILPAQPVPLQWDISANK